MLPPAPRHGFTTVSEANAEVLAELARAAEALLTEGRKWVRNISSPEKPRDLANAHIDLLLAERAYFVATGEIRLTAQPWRKGKTFIPPVVIRYHVSRYSTEAQADGYGRRRTLQHFADFMEADRAARLRYMHSLRIKHVKGTLCSPSRSRPSKSSPAMLTMTRPSPRSPDAT